MKQIIVRVALLVVSVLLLFGCHKVTTADLSKVTYYVQFEMMGEGIMTVNMGTPYVDPGCKAFEKETDVTHSIVVNGAVDTSKEGIYSINYSAKNSDGFVASATRIVVVTSAGSLTGRYNTSITRNNGGTISNRGPFYIDIEKAEDGSYHISDFLGGWYDFGSGYGPDYAAAGVFKLLPDNTMELVSSHLAGWGDEIASLDASSYDSATGTLRFTSIYAGGMKFAVTATIIK